jgi:hypothetical protein
MNEIVRKKMLMRLKKYLNERVATPETIAASWLALASSSLKV